MKKINNRKFEVTSGDLSVIGSEVDRLLGKIKGLEYGTYDAAENDLEAKLALKIIEGMYDWQWEHNKGVSLQGDIHIQVDIYEMHERQKRLDAMMSVDLYKTD